MRQIRTELRQATSERKSIDQRIRRLRAAEAALYGRRPKPQLLSREQLKDHLAEHPAVRATEIADELGVPLGSVRTLLSAMKQQGEVVNERQRWSLSHNQDTVG